MPVIEATGLRKTYGGITALNGCDLRIAAGTVHALLGENGAGKSTLVKILTGAVRPDAGRILIDGAPARFRDTADAARHGVAVVSQELNLFPDLDVLANLYTKREILRYGVFDRPAMTARAEPVLAELGLHVSPRALVGSLPLAQRQLVEIAKALLTNPRVLVLDEPTSALDEAGSQRLLHVLRALRDRRVGVLFVSHILEEVLAVSDRITVLRDGAVVVAAARRADMSVERIVAAMLGDRPPAPAPAARATVAAEAGPALSAEQITLPGILHGVTVHARPGEIVGLAGVVGAGHSDLLRVLSGQHRGATGRLRLPGDPDQRRRRGRLPRNLRGAVRSGIALVAGDRQFGLMPDKPIWINIAQVRSVSLARDGALIRRARLRGRARRQIAALAVRTTSVDEPAGLLSGGNQQKVVLAKWFEAAPSVLLLDDPTRGVDVGAKAEIHRLIRAAGAGRVTLICSTDLDELVNLCDRVVVLRRGRVAAELSGDRLDRHTLLEQMNATT
ncbi:sugar ABC transporter ATP-binding protein [Actinoplanes sp. L3-i22]|uniref:sugar ABC transporter ATP-binding protein n=1 Tax=Actinoplanes sp. L3-i22 TaxID=2836373 RepID=UPI001C778FF1|nr:sugar ABC transporter ATP-binding protein [Actinoplanes sp. L3-i22]BCY09350.1 ribose import ATP-binding protein RbsA [Actinoplanes sp. L3-i22]